jgi:hypothetical protein
VNFSPRPDLTVIMGIFALPRTGGHGIERELQRLPNYTQPVALKDLTPSLELDGYRIALVGRMMLHAMDGTTTGATGLLPLGPADWDQWSDYMNEAGLKLARAVKARDGQKASDRLGDLHSTCVSCHNLYTPERRLAVLAATRPTHDLLSSLRVGSPGDPNTFARALVRRGAYRNELDSVLTWAVSDADVRIRDSLKRAVDYYADAGDVPVLAALLRVFRAADSAASPPAAAALRRSALRPLVDVRGVQQILDEADDRVCVWFAAHGDYGRDHLARPRDRIRPVRLPELLEKRGLTDRDLAIRVTAAALLAQLGVKAEELMPALDAGLLSPDAQVRRQAVQVVRRLRTTVPSIPGLIRSLRDPDPIVRGRAGIALSRAGKAAVPSLVAVLKDDSADARASAMSTLARIGPDARAAVPVLLDVFKGPDAYQSKLAAIALKKIDPKAADAAGAH